MSRRVHQARFYSLLLSLFFIFNLWPASNVLAQRGTTAPAPRTRPNITTSEQSQPTTTNQNSKDESTQADEVVRVETDLTNVLFTAIDKDRQFVTTLRKEDVRVLENGTPQEIFSFERETDLPLSLAILVDASKSQERTLPDEKAAARTFIDSVIRPDKDQAAVISFTGEATLEQSLTGNRQNLNAAIERLQIVLPPERADGTIATDPTQDPRGWSGIWDASWVSVNEVLSQTPERTRRAIILLTDGDDTSSVTKKQEVIDRAIKANTVIYAIGIGDRKDYRIDEGALRKVSEKTGGRAFFPRDETDLRAAFAQIQQELRSQYLIAYAPSNKARDGSFRQINIEITNPELRKQKLRLLYRQGYYAKQREAANGTK